MCSSRYSVCVFALCSALVACATDTTSDGSGSADAGTPDVVADASSSADTVMPQEDVQVASDAHGGEVTDDVSASVDADAVGFEVAPLPSLEAPFVFEPGEGEGTPRIQTTVALGGTDELAVAWTGVMGEDNALVIRFARYGLDGTVKTAPYTMSTTTTGVHNEPSLCALAGGGYVAAWSRDTQSVGPDGENLEVRVRLVAADGSPVGDADTRVLSEVPGNHWLGEVACSPTGGFVVGGVRRDTDGITFGAFAWRYSAAGESEGSAMALNVTPEGTQVYPDLAVNADGAVAAIWLDDTEPTPGVSLVRVLLRWLPPSPAEPGDVLVIAGAEGAPSPFGQVVSAPWSTEARVVAMLAGGGLGLWSVSVDGTIAALQAPEGTA
ncbi:MAG: hypothetical protein QF464_19960, partial [Myxococcota bacterium]|nr:hypothetical protein [Myxococcota bacterium]